MKNTFLRMKLPFNFTINQFTKEKEKRDLICVIVNLDAFAKYGQTLKSAIQSLECRKHACFVVDVQVGWLQKSDNCRS